MSVMVGGANPIEIGNMLYLELDAQVIEYEMEDTIFALLSSAKAVRVRTGIYTRTRTPPILGYCEYEFLAWKERK